MLPWLEALAVAVLAVLGHVLGRWFSRRPKPYWAFGYVVPLLLTVAIALTRWFPRLAFAEPFCWVMYGRAEFAILAAACTILLTTPLSRLPHRAQKTAVTVFMIFGAGYFLLPFVLPGCVRSRLARLETRFGRDGICRQSTRYTCGPAAAVTVLRKRGLPAEESELALLAKTIPITGTQPDSLCLAIRRRYARDAIRCDYRYFESIAELRDCCPMIALIKLGFLVDHYVAVLSVADDRVTIGDPLGGIREVTFGEFKAIWRRCGIVVTRNAKHPSQ